MSLSRAPGSPTSAKRTLVPPVSQTRAGKGKAKAVMGGYNAGRWARGQATRRPSRAVSHPPGRTALIVLYFEPGRVATKGRVRECSCKHLKSLGHESNDFAKSSVAMAYNAACSITRNAGSGVERKKAAGQAANAASRS